jgi:hypothetical protein
VRPASPSHSLASLWHGSISWTPVDPSVHLKHGRTTAIVGPLAPHTLRPNRTSQNYETPREMTRHLVTTILSFTITLAFSSQYLSSPPTVTAIVAVNVTQGGESSTS